MAQQIIAKLIVVKIVVLAFEIGQPLNQVVKLFLVIFNGNLCFQRFKNVFEKSDNYQNYLDDFHYYLDSAIFSNIYNETIIQFLELNSQQYFLFDSTI